MPSRAAVVEHDPTGDLTSNAANERTGRRRTYQDAAVHTTRPVQRRGRSEMQQRAANSGLQPLEKMQIERVIDALISPRPAAATSARPADRDVVVTVLTLQHDPGHDHRR